MRFYLSGCRDFQKSITWKRKCVRYNSLVSSLKNQIKLLGPISVKSYISQCLYHPQYGYYSKGAKLGGKDCDYVTAPEVSRIFGMLIGYFIKFEVENIFDQFGKKVRVVELGPGNGTLMRDALETFVLVKDKIQGITMIDSSTFLAKNQAESLDCGHYCEKSATFIPVTKDNVFKGEHFTGNGISVSWLQSIHNFNYEGPCIFFMNEYFDALPVHLYTKLEGNDWNPISINYDDEKNKFFMARRPASNLNNYEDLILKEYYKAFDWAEFSMENFAQWRHILNIVNNNGGCILNIDYGYTKEGRPDQFTLRSFKDHKVCTILDYPGESDITSDIDFCTFEKIANTYTNLKCYEVITQQKFLEELGINDIAKIMNEKYPINKEHTNCIIQYLTSPEKMGTRFKVQIITGKDQCEPLCF